ncbi:MAG TPA: cysteine--tRNA ligase [Rhizobiales bacterium]|nr:cysteine--tRNA ligase [Hyphomicrobiales bacterium]
MSEGFKGLRLYNTLTRAKEDFVPIDPQNVRMYVCGPTVYDYAHIGNARPAIVFDVLYRLLRHLYGPDHVTYVRNITDVDDKINARALRDFGAEIAAGRLSLNEAIRKVTEPTYEQYQKDVGALGCLPPTYQPRATEFVLPRADGKADMVTMIQSLIDRGHAYVANGEVLFDVTSMPDYGQLSKRPLDEQQAGARIAVEAHKKNPADFVLWKESTAEEPGWEAHFDLKDGSHVHIHGRPGWHIECSAMSDALLWDAVKDRLSPEALARPHQFDIHGGGLDLIFPHHENEIAQSRCAHGTEVMANYWLHNGFLQVEGRKMSKSEGNFVTIHELLETEKFGGRKWPGEVLRLAMLMTHYRQPIDFTVEKLLEAEKKIVRWGKSVYFRETPSEDFISPDVISFLLDDINFWPAVKILDDLSYPGNAGDGRSHETLEATLRFLGLLMPYNEFERMLTIADEDTKLMIDARIEDRLAFIREKNWAEADRIRDELLAQGIQLKDGKDPATGERTTTWEVKR